MSELLRAISILEEKSCRPAAVYACRDVRVRCHDAWQVDKPEQYGFHPDRLLLRMSELMLRLAEGPAFVAAVAEEPDYDEDILLDVHARLLKKQLGEYGVAARLEALVQQV